MSKRDGLSVVIVTRDRVASVMRAIASIRQSAESLPDWELVIVAHNCCDDTQARVEEYFPDLPIRVLTYQGECLSLAKNHALDDLHARFTERLVVMTDDDVTVASDWLPRMYAAACQWGDRYLFGGPITPVFPQAGTLAEALMRYEWLASPLFAAKPGGEIDGQTKAEPFGPNMAFWLSASRDIRFHQLFGPPACMGEETVFMRDMARDGRQFIHVRSAQVWHHLRDEQLTQTWMNHRMVHWGKTLARFQVRYQAGEDAQYRIGRFRRRARIRSVKSALARRLPGLSAAYRLRLHLRALQSNATHEEYLRLACSPARKQLRHAGLV